MRQSNAGCLHQMKRQTTTAEEQQRRNSGRVAVKQSDEGEMLTQETADHAQCENKAVVGLQGSCRCGRSALSMFEDRLRKRDGKCDICIYFL